MGHRKCDVVKRKFDSHLSRRKTVIHEKPKLNQRVQGQDELWNVITDLYRLVEFCEYGSLKEEMIRDRLVVGIRNEKLSEKLQLNTSLTLENAAHQVRHSKRKRKRKRKRKKK